MKKLIVLSLIIGFGLTLFGQDSESYTEVMRSALKTEKKAMIAEVMIFTDVESEAFWPMYNEYQEKLYTANTKYLKIVNDFAANFENMTDEKATELMSRWNSHDAEIHKLKKAYVKKFSKILPPTKVLRYFQAENKIDLLIDFEMSTYIPLLETK